MLIMSASKGFSLIETLVAVALASVAVLALMQVVSNSSRASEKAISHLDSSIRIGLVAGEANETLDGRSMSVDEILLTRYHIDHPAIIESLKEPVYQITFGPKEMLDLPMATNLIGMNAATVIAPIAIQKVLIENREEKKTFFRITSDGVQ